MKLSFTTQIYYKTICILIEENFMEIHDHIGNYKVIKKIGEGSFGQIFQATKDDSIFAIKTENIGNIKSMIALEYQIFKKLQSYSDLSKKLIHQANKGFSFPKVYQYKQQDHFSYMVMEKLDITLQDLVNLELKNEISKDVLLLIMYNTFSCLKTLHEIGYLYRDVKPSNFMLKRSQLEDKKGKIYLIDLGLCKKFTKKDSQQHISIKYNKRMIGTPIFCSINTHNGIQISRRDDLQSWVYMIIYLIKKLPWQIHSAHSLPNHSMQTEADIKQTASDKIGKTKKSTNINQLIREQSKLPSCLTKIYDHIRHLQFQTKPDYHLIEKWITEDFEKIIDNKIKISEVFFRTQTHVKKEQIQQKKPIKITFKAPNLSNKLKKKNLQQINIVKILEG